MEVEVLESRRVDGEPGRGKAAESFETAASRAGFEGDPGAEGFFPPPLSCRSKPASPMDNVVAGLLHRSVAAAFWEK